MLLLFGRKKFFALKTRFEGWGVRKNAFGAKKIFFAVGRRTSGVGRHASDLGTGTWWEAEILHAGITFGVGGAWHGTKFLGFTDCPKMVILWSFLAFFGYKLRILACRVLKIGV